MKKIIQKWIQKGKFFFCTINKFFSGNKDSFNNFILSKNNLKSSTIILTILMILNIFNLFLISSIDNNNDNNLELKIFSNKKTKIYERVLQENTLFFNNKERVYKMKNFRMLLNEKKSSLQENEKNGLYINNDNPDIKDLYEHNKDKIKNETSFLLNTNFDKKMI